MNSQKSGVLDRRIQRTHRLLHDALISLVLEKDYDTITIRDITERADIAYATFFRHYQDKEELLMDVVQAVIQEIEAITQQMTHLAEAVTIFTHAQANKQLYLVVLNSQGAGSILPRTQQKIADSIREECKSFLEREPSIPIEVTTNHFAASLLALIRWWLENDMPYSPERMSEIYHELIFQPTQAALTL